MDYFFHPDGVAVIGATDNPVKGGYHILRNTLGGYVGRVYPVNPRYREILGVKCYPDVPSIPDRFELAIFFVPAAHLPQAIRDCARKGVKGIIIESAGFSEVGDEGRRLQAECVALARSLGIRLWGPNCMGLLDGHSRNVFSFMYTDAWKTLMKPGNVSLIVQSGMLSAGFLMTILEKGGMGISKVCSIGNKCDVNETDLLEYMISDGETEVIACYLESIVEGRRFLELARSTGKPVIVLKSGRSREGARAAMSHTASLSGNESVYRGAFRQAGIITVHDVNELMDFARGFSMLKASPGEGGAAVITFSGGGGIVTTDFLADHGIPLAEFSPETKEALKSLYPAWMPPSNPADLWPAVELHGVDRVFTEAGRILARDRGVNSLIVHAIAWHINTPDYLVEFGELSRRHGKPVVVWLIGGQEVREKFRLAAEDAGVPVYAEMERCVKVLAGIQEHFRKKGRLQSP